MKEYKINMLTQALDGRKKEIEDYQVNIDNFIIAIDLIQNDPELSQFKEQLEGLLKSNLFEQKKSKIMLQAIEKQLTNLNA